MSDEKMLLDVGDVFYTQSYSTLNRHIVDRVTPKQAHSKTVSVKRDIQTMTELGNKRRCVSVIGSYGTANLETPELLKKYRDQQTMMKAQRLHHDFKIYHITPEVAQKLIEFYASITTKP